jgi:hypothetical protein
MYIGDVNARTKEEAERFRQLTFTCLENINTRDPQTLDFPQKPCKTGIMTAVRFPTYVFPQPTIPSFSLSTSPTPSLVIFLTRA